MVNEKLNEKLLKYFYKKTFELKLKINWTFHTNNILKLFWALQCRILKFLHPIPTFQLIPCLITQQARISSGTLMSTRPQGSIWTHLIKCSKENLPNKKKDKKIKTTSPEKDSTWTMISKLPNLSLPLVPILFYVVEHCNN